MNIINSPYLYHPHPLLKAAADDVCKYISERPEWVREFGKGKMLGALLCRKPANDFESATKGQDVYATFFAYSGLVDIVDSESFFVPAVYDLNNPDDFYLLEDKAISQLNIRIATCNDAETITQLKSLRRKLSQDLQLKIFRHFNFVNLSGGYKNIVDIFAEAKRGLPPGGSGECAAPRLLQFAIRHGFTPVAIAEFWYGTSPRKEIRAHRQFYPSCIEKCSPILRYMLGDSIASDKPNDAPPSLGTPHIIHEDEHLIVLSKPSGLLSTPAKDLTQPNVETWLHQQYPEVKGPMLAHRLDQATSGVMLAAKDAQTHKALQSAFETKKIRKRYVAWLDGILPSETGYISLPICTNPDDRPRQTVDWQFGKQALTRYNKICVKDGRTLIEFFPLTGRTHQLRLHAASPFGLDIPIVGDGIYGTGGQRLMLHAECVKLELGIGIPLEFHDPSGFE